MADLSRLSDRELTRRARGSHRRRGRSNRGEMRLRDVQERTMFYTDGEVAVTAELQRRGLINGDGQIMSRRGKFKQK